MSSQEVGQIKREFFTKCHKFLHGSILLIENKLNTSRELSDLSKYSAIRSSLIALVKTAVPGSKIDVHFFGSRIIGLASEGSDLDIFVEIDGTFNSTFVRSPTHDGRFRFITAILRTSKIWKVQKPLLETTVPIIICYYAPMRLNCDLNFTNGLSVRNSKLIAHLFAVQPEAASLYHFVKEWIVAHGLTYLKGYTLTLLVVFYLQNKRLMPSVENVQQGLPKQIIGRWEAQFNPERNLADYRIQRIDSYKPHISVFFRFYSTFDYSWVMSTFRGFAIDSATYGERYPEFRMQGILIPGPCNKATNCGVMRDDLRDQFIKLCAASAEFFNHCSCWNRSNR